jgi:hypothetical protein
MLLMERENIVSILILIIIFFIAFSFSYFYVTKKIIDELSSTGEIYSKGMMDGNWITLKDAFNSEEALRELCKYETKGKRSVKLGLEEVNFSDYILKSCDLSKIREKLNNPEQLNSKEIMTYSIVSLKYEVMRSYYEESYNYFAKRSANKISDVISAMLTQISKTSSFSISYLFFSGTFDACLKNNLNFTENEKKECLIEVLKAEEKMTPLYENTHMGDVDYCKKMSIASFSPLQNKISLFNLPRFFSSTEPRFVSFFFYLNIRSICQGMIEREGETTDNLLKKDISNHAKFLISLSSCYMTNYIGPKDSCETDNRKINEILIEKIENPKYKQIFESLKI